MAYLIRLFALWFLAACLASTSVTMAVARSAAKVHYSVVICGMEGVVQITLDAQGNPTGPMHPCPDCVAGVAMALPLVAGATLRPLKTSRFRPVLPPQSIWHAQVLAAMARGPPFFI
jgi:hypothetical protein